MHLRLICVACVPYRTPCTIRLPRTDMETRLCPEDRKENGGQGTQTAWLHRIVQIATGEDEDALPPQGKRSGGIAGGAARREKLTPKRRSEIAKKAAQARWVKAREGRNGA